jgi:hypothetical protein
VPVEVACLEPDALVARVLIRLDGMQDWQDWQDWQRRGKGYGLADDDDLSS